MTNGDIGSVKKKLSEIEHIEYSLHYEGVKSVRNLSKEGVESNLKHTEGMFSVEFQPDKMPGEKYRLIFKKSSKYDEVIVVNFKDLKTLKVVTAHIQSVKKARKVEKWLKKQR